MCIYIMHILYIYIHIHGYTPMSRHCKHLMLLALYNFNAFDNVFDKNISIALLDSEILVKIYFDIYRYNRVSISEKIQEVAFSLATRLIVSIRSQTPMHRCLLLRTNLHNDSRIVIV